VLRVSFCQVTKYLETEKEINIYVGLTEMQRKWYRSVLEKDIDAVNGQSYASPGGSMSLTYCYHRSHREKGRENTFNEHGHASALFSLSAFAQLNLSYQLRKVTCHPYLFDGAVYIILLFV
jgi:SWI/SNF-related matrix-associated actin-dependent regulator of chromatin subfamily A member 5